jgi:hypothetical protein
MQSPRSIQAQVCDSPVLRSSAGRKVVLIVLVALETCYYAIRHFYVHASNSSVAGYWCDLHVTVDARQMPFNVFLDEKGKS